MYAGNNNWLKCIYTCILLPYLAHEHFRLVATARLIQLAVLKCLPYNKIQDTRCMIQSLLFWFSNRIGYRNAVVKKCIWPKPVKFETAEYIQTSRPRKYILYTNMHSLAYKITNMYTHARTYTLTKEKVLN